MEMDHTKLAVSLKMAAPHGLAVPKDNSDVAVLNSLSGLHGKRFDTAYIRQVGLDGHEKAVAAFHAEADGRQSADFKRLLKKLCQRLKSI